MSAGVTVNCVHPGLTYTRTWKFLSDSLQPVIEFILKVFFKLCNQHAHINLNTSVFQNVLFAFVHEVSFLSLLM